MTALSIPAELLAVAEELLDLTASSAPAPDQWMIDSALVSR